jgi:hypothetical protein
MTTQPTPGFNPTVKCQQCGHIRPVAQLKPIMRAVEGKPDTFDIGFTCPACGYFYHAAYTNDALMRLQRQAELVRRPVERAKLFRAYKRKFDAFQVEMETAKETEGTS